MYIEDLIDKLKEKLTEIGNVPIYTTSDYGEEEISGIWVFEEKLSNPFDSNSPKIPKRIVII